MQRNGARPMRFAFLWMFLLLIVLSLAAAEKKMERISQLEKRISTVQGREKVDMLNELSPLYLPENIAKALETAENARILAGALGYIKGAAEALIRKAKALTEGKNYKEAVQTFMEAKNLYLKVRDRGQALQASYHAGRACFLNDEYDLAIPHFLEIIKNNEIPSLERNGWYVDAFIKMAIIQRRRGALENSMEYIQTGLKIAKKNRNEEYIAAFFLQSGLIQKNLKHLDRALKDFYSTLNTKMKPDHLVMMNARENIAKIKLMTGEYSDAEAQYLKLLEYYQKNRYYIELVIVYTNLAELASRRKAFKRSEDYYRQAFDMEKELNQYDHDALLRSYADFCFQTGKYQEAYEIQSRWIALRDKIFKKEKEMEILRLQEKFDSDRLKDENIRIRNERRIQVLSRNLLIAVLVLVLLAMSLFIKRYLYLFAFWKREKFIGQYRLLESAGSGGMGIVYKAHPVSDKNRLVCIKVMKEELMQSEIYKKRFKREGMIIDRLRHPHILRVYERGEDGAKPYIVTEWVQGITLEKHISECGPLHPPEAIHIASQVCSALERLHEEKIVHRDLKPSNIMLEEKEGDSCFVKLLDFGLSKISHHSRLTQPGMMVGTLNYIAPEVIGSDEYTPASDIYSLGVILHEMLTGALLFREDSLTLMVDRIMDEAPESPGKRTGGIPAVIDSLMASVLDKDPGKRPSAVRLSLLLRDLQFRFSLPMDERRSHEKDPLINHNFSNL